MSRLNKLNEKRQIRVVHERTREEKPPARYPGLIFTLIFILTGALVYLIVFSGALRIRDVEVNGYSRPEELRAAVVDHYSGRFLGDNILFLDAGSLEEKIGENSRINSVTVKKVLPNRLTLVVNESIGSIVWNTAGESFVIDDRGHVIEKINNPDLPAVFDNANIPIGLGERVASPTFIKYIIDISSNFALITGEQIDRIIILDILSDVHVKSKSGWTVYLDSTKEPVAQLENLSKVLRSAAESGHTKLQYIDMRLQDKVFYK